MQFRTLVATATAAFALVSVPSVLAGEPLPIGPPLGVKAPSKRFGTTVARVVLETNALEAPGAGAVVWRVKTEAIWGGGPQQLMVLGAKRGADGQDWIEVQLPIKPNGRTGWIRADYTKLKKTPYWLQLSLRTRVVTVFKKGRKIRRFRSVIGQPQYPTPRGFFAIYERVAQDDPNGFVGPWTVHLTAQSTVLDQFDGGPPRIALHGRGPSSFGDPLGSARSHGCIRVNNREINWVARFVIPGTPFEVKA